MEQNDYHDLVEWVRSRIPGRDRPGHFTLNQLAERIGIHRGNLYKFREGLTAELEPHVIFAIAELMGRRALAGEVTLSEPTQTRMVKARIKRSPESPRRGYVAADPGYSASIPDEIEITEDEYLYILALRSKDKFASLHAARAQLAIGLSRIKGNPTAKGQFQLAISMLDSLIKQLDPPPEEVKNG